MCARFFGVFGIICCLLVSCLALSPVTALASDVSVDNSSIDTPTPAYTLDNGSDSPASGSLKALIEDIIGDYSPVIVEYRYSNNNNSYGYIREVQLDYEWIFSAVVFVVCLFCVFKGVFAWICRR